MELNFFFYRLTEAEFFGLYIGYCGLIIAGWILIRRFFENKNQISSIETISTFDLYEIAYLRNKEKAVLETLIYRLPTLGYLVITKERELVLSNAMYDGNDKDLGLTLFEKDILKIFYAKGLTKKGLTSSILNSKDVLEKVKYYCFSFIEKVTRMGLILSGKGKRYYLISLISGEFILLFPGMARIMWAWVTLQTSILLLFLIIWLCFIGYMWLWMFYPTHLSSMGKTYFESLKKTHNNTKISSLSIALGGLSTLLGASPFGTSFTDLSLWTSYGSLPGGIRGSMPIN